MKKIFNFGLALAVVAAMALVGCSGGTSVDIDTGIGGDTTIDGGKFAAGSFTGKGVPTDTIKAADSLDTDGKAKIIDFGASDSFKLFYGETESKDDWEGWLEEPRTISRPNSEYYNVKYVYYDIALGGASTKYFGYGKAFDDFPTEDKLNWTKYTYYDGKSDETKWVAKDLSSWDKDWESARFVMAVDGKYYSVYANGSKMDTDETALGFGYWDENDDEYKWVDAKFAGNGDTITVDKSYSYGKKDNNDRYIVSVTNKTVYKDGGDCEWTYEYKVERRKTDDKGKYYWEPTAWYTYTDEEGNAVKGNWSNNNGLISESYDSYVRTNKVPGLLKTEISYAPSVTLWYWNGSRLSNAGYLGAYYDGEIPAAAKSGTENKTEEWRIGGGAPWVNDYWW